MIMFVCGLQPTLTSVSRVLACTARVHRVSTATRAAVTPAGRATTVTVSAPNFAFNHLILPQFFTLDYDSSLVFFFFLYTLELQNFTFLTHFIRFYDKKLS